VIFDHFIPQPQPSGEASPQRMFWFLLPGAMFVAIVLGFYIILSAFRYDIRANSMVCCPLFSLPFALSGVVHAISEVKRPNGMIALLHALPLAAAVVIVPLVFLWVVMVTNSFREFSRGG